MKIRTQVKAGAWTTGHDGGWTTNHNETLAVRTALKAGFMRLPNHNETLTVRTALKGGQPPPCGD